MELKLNQMVTNNRKTTKPTITIIAPGLLGASLGSALYQYANARVHLWARREEVRQECASMAWCEAVFETPADAVTQADGVFLCAPVSKIPVLAHQIRDGLSDDTIVSDVGSTKGKLVRDCVKALAGKGRFVGSHPMAGSEKTGHAHADANLFLDKPCFVTIEESTDPEAAATLKQWWQQIGMQVSQCSPDEHDEIVAHISHLPHLVACGIAYTLQTMNKPDWQSFVSSGFLDTTRVASGDSAMWHDILQDNREMVLSALRRYMNEVESLYDHLKYGRMDEVVSMLAQARSYRECALKRNESGKKCEG